MLASPPAPYDRALALASLVRTMRDHALEVRCGCGARRVIALQQMARDRRTAGLTLAHVALRLRCESCHNGPDEVRLTARFNEHVPSNMTGPVWVLPLVERKPPPSYHRKWMK